MNANDWQMIPGQLKGKGFTVLYERVSYAPENPLWRARASRNGQEWNTLGRDLEAALVELERQTNESVPDWRGVIAFETSGDALTKSPVAN
jgi:hypothetical protein